MVRKDLLKKALEVDEGYFEYKKLRLHNSLINKLRKHYKIYEAVQNFYDDEDIEDKEKRMEHLTWQELIGPEYGLRRKKKQTNRLLIGLNGLKGRVCRRKIDFISQKETEKSGFIFTAEIIARIITSIL